MSTFQDENNNFSDYLHYGPNAGLMSCLYNFGPMYESSPEPWGIFTPNSSNPNRFRYAFTTTPVIDFSYTVPYLKANFNQDNTDPNDMYYAQYIKDQWSSIYWGFDINHIHVMSSDNIEESKKINECIDYSKYLNNPQVSDAILKVLFSKINSILNSIPDTDSLNTTRNIIIDNTKSGFPPDCSFKQGNPPDVKIEYTSRDKEIDYINQVFDTFINEITSLSNLLHITSFITFQMAWPFTWSSFYSSFNNLKELASKIIKDAQKVYDSNDKLMKQLLNQGLTNLANIIKNINIIGSSIYSNQTIISELVTPIDKAINDSGVLNNDFVPSGKLSIENESDINGLFMSFTNHMKDDTYNKWVPEDYQSRKPSYTVICDPDTKESVYTITYPYDPDHVSYGESVWGLRQNYDCVFPFNPDTKVNVSPIPANAPQTPETIALQQMQNTMNALLNEWIKQGLPDSIYNQYLTVKNQYNALYKQVYGSGTQSSSSSEELGCYRLRVMNSCSPFKDPTNRTCLSGKFVIQMIKRRYPTFNQKESSSSSYDIELGYHITSQNSEDIVVGGIDRIDHINSSSKYALLKNWYDMDLDIKCTNILDVGNAFPHYNNIVYFTLKNQPLSDIKDILNTKEMFKIDNDYNPFIGLPKKYACKLKNGIDFFADSNCEICCDTTHPNQLFANVNFCPQCFECTLEDGSKSYRYVEFLDNGPKILLKSPNPWPEDDACTYEVTGLRIRCTCVTKPTSDYGNACSATVAPLDINNATLRIYFLNGRVEASLVAKSKEGSDDEFVWFYGMQKLIGQNCNRKYRIPSITSLPEPTRLMPLTGEVTIAPDGQTPQPNNVCGDCSQDEWALTLLVYIELDIGLKLMIFKDTQWYNFDLPDTSKGFPPAQKVVFKNQFNKDDFLGKKFQFDNKELEYLLDTFWGYKFLTSLKNDKIIIGKNGTIEAYPCLIPPNGISSVDYDALFWTDMMNNNPGNYPYVTAPSKDYCGFFDYEGPAYYFANIPDTILPPSYNSSQKGSTWVNSTDLNYRTIDKNLRPNTIFTPPSVTHDSFTMHVCDEEILVNQAVKVTEIGSGGICKLKDYFPIFVYSISTQPISGLTKNIFMKPSATPDSGSLYNCLASDPNLENWSGDNLPPEHNKESNKEVHLYHYRSPALSPYIYDAIPYNKIMSDKGLSGSERQCKSSSAFVSKSNVGSDWYKLKQSVSKGTTLYISGIFARKRHLRQIVQTHTMFSADRPVLYKFYEWGKENEDIPLNSIDLHDKYNAITSSKLAGHKKDIPISITSAIDFTPVCMKSDLLEVDIDIWRMSELSSNATILHRTFLKKFPGYENNLLANPLARTSTISISNLNNDTTSFAFAMDSNGIIILNIKFDGSFTQSTLINKDKLNQDWFNSYLQANNLVGQNLSSNLNVITNTDYTNNVTSGMLYDVSRDICQVVRDHYKLPYIRSFALAIKKLREDGGKVTKDFNSDDYSKNIRRLDIVETKYDKSDQEITITVISTGGSQKIPNPFYNDDLTNAIFIPSGSSAIYKTDTNKNEYYNFNNYGIYLNGYFKKLGLGPFLPAFYPPDYNQPNQKPKFYALKNYSIPCPPEKYPDKDSIYFDWSDAILYNYFYLNPNFINVFGDIGRTFNPYTINNGFFRGFEVYKGIICPNVGSSNKPNDSKISIDVKKNPIYKEYYFYNDKSNKKFTSLPIGYYDIQYINGGLQWTGRLNIMSIHDPILSLGNGVFFYNTSVPPAIYSSFQGTSGYEGYSGYKNGPRYSPIGRLTPGDLKNNLSAQYIRNVYNTISQLQSEVSNNPCKTMTHLGGKIFVKIQSNNLTPINADDSENLLLQYKLYPLYITDAYLYASFVDQWIYNIFSGIKITIVTPDFYIPSGLGKHVRIFIESAGIDKRGSGIIKDHDRPLRCGGIMPNYAIEYMAGDLNGFTPTSVNGTLSVNPKEFKELAVLTCPEFCHNAISYHFLDDPGISSFAQYGSSFETVKKRADSLETKEFLEINKSIPNKYTFKMPTQSGNTQENDTIISKIVCDYYYPILCDYHLLPQDFVPTNSSSSSEGLCVRADQITSLNNIYYKRGMLINGITGALTVGKVNSSVIQKSDIIFGLKTDHYEYFDQTHDNYGFRMYTYFDIKPKEKLNESINIDFMSIGSANKVNEIDNLTLYGTNSSTNSESNQTPTPTSNINKNIESLRFDLGYSEGGIMALFGDKVSLIDSKISAQFINYSDFSNFKAQGTSSSIVCDNDGVIYIFYEDIIISSSSSSDDGENPPTNISVAISWDRGVTWYQHRDIIRLLIKESARMPYAVTNYANKIIHLFYIYNDNFLCVKNIDTTMFVNNSKNTYQRMEKYLEVFDKNTANEAGLEYYDINGQILRRSICTIIEGDLGTNTSAYTLTQNKVNCSSSNKTSQKMLKNGKTVLERLKNELEVVNPQRLQSSDKDIRIKDGGITGVLVGNGNLGWIAYKNKSNILRTILMNQNGLMSIKSGDLHGLTWEYSAKDFYINKTTDSFFINNNNSNQNTTNKLSSQLKDYYYNYSYICNTNTQWKDAYLGECKILSKDGYAIFNDLINNPNPDLTRCSKINNTTIQVTYNSKTNEFSVLYFFLGKLFVRNFQEDLIYYLEEYYNNISNNIVVDEDVKFVIENHFGLTTYSENKPLFIAGTDFTDEEKKTYNGLYTMTKNSKIQNIVTTIQPAAYYNKTNLLKIYYMDETLSIWEVIVEPSDYDIYKKQG